MFNAVYNGRQQSLRHHGYKFRALEHRSKEATEDGLGLPGFCCSVEPFLSSPSFNMTSSSHERSKKTRIVGRTAALSGARTQFSYSVCSFSLNMLSFERS